MMTTLSHIWATIMTSIEGMGYIPFGVLVIVNIILYRLHPVIGFLGTLFLFAVLTGMVG